MKKIVNWRVASFILWVMITVGIVVTMPNLDQLVREKGQVSIPESSESIVAEKMIKEMNEENGNQYQIIAVFNSGSDKQLTEEQKKDISTVIDELENKKNELGIVEMLTHLDSEYTEKELVSEEETTILTQISVDAKKGEISEVAEQLNKIIKSDSVDIYLTGNGLVLEDFVQSSQEGIKKTEIIAIIFIVAVLIIMFRSPIIPTISLLSVGVSYIVSLGIIAHLVDSFNYPFSNFTQVFLVVILFGIGTDYNILLFTRFKEELAKQEDVLEAVKATYKTAGKTVVYSAVAVFIGFIALFFAEFQLYRASSAVAIGVFVLVFVLVTLNPFFMVLLGKKLFWPIKKIEGHDDSKIWGFLSKFSVFRPVISLVFVALLCIPFIWSYSGTLSYNDLLEVDDKYESKQGINVIEEHFSAGFSSPAMLAIQSEQSLENPESLQAIDEVVERISKVQGVANVYSVTRPFGEKIDDFYLKEQTSILNDGLNEANDGVNEINDGLTSAEDQLGQTDSQSLSNVQKLIDGTNEIKDGVGTLAEGISQLSAGVSSGADGAKQLEEGLSVVNDNMGTLSSSMSELQDAYSELQNGLSTFSSYFEGISKAIDAATQGYERIEASMKNLLQTNPELASNVDVQTTLAVAANAKEQLAELSAQLNNVTPQYSAAMDSFSEANGALTQINNGFSQLQNGVNELHEGAESLSDGLQTAADGSNVMANNVPQLETGLTKINDGQKQLLTGLTELSEKMEDLQTGLSESTEGLSQISSGLTDANEYLSGLGDSSASEMFFITQDVINSEDFKDSLNMYMSSDYKATQIRIILDVNPYTKEAMNIVANVKEEISTALKGSELSEATFALGGKSSENVDLEEMASGDFISTATFMLIGIGIVLIIITRSIIKPILIIGSLIITYYTSLGLSELLSTTILPVNELGWNVPFFSFIMIVALGVDYSIFYMMRYREIEGKTTQAIIEAARNIGGVVISAAIILGGTFAALIPSGVLTLIEVATTVIIGLTLLSFVMLPIFIPAGLSAFNRIKSKLIRKETR